MFSFFSPTFVLQCLSAVRTKKMVRRLIESLDGAMQYYSKYVVIYKQQLSNRSCCISKQACTFLIFLFSQAPVELQVKEVADGIALACSDQSDVTSNTKTDIKTKSLHLPYRDDSTGEYKCGENDLIFVKFRSKFCRETCVHNMKRKCLIFLYCLYTFITYLSTVMLRKKMSAPVFIHNVCLCVCFSSL